jgi:C-terminal processing protease CtpA/Prc
MLKGSNKLSYDKIIIDKDSIFIGYITLETIKETDIFNIKKSFINAKGIIIDIRNYPATFVPFLLGNYFTSKKKPFVKFTIVNANNPGEFNFSPVFTLNESRNTNNYLNAFKTFESETHFQRKLVVIVNEETISQAEYTAMAFRAGDNTVIIGSQTQGADGNVSVIVLPGGLKTLISGIGIYYPDGRGTQRIGIVPDIEVKPTIRGIREGRDELLEKAIEIIKQE